MSAEWKEFRLGYITEWASGGTPSKKNANFWNGTIPWISASSMASNRYDDSNLKITPEGLKTGSRLAEKDSILLLVRGSALHKRIPVGIATSDVSFNQDVKSIIAKEDFIEPWYLLFWFMAKEKDLLNMVENTGIGAGKLDTNRLQDMLIKIPSGVERNRICRFAKALDDKLLLNRQINQTLESMAQAIFKSWFVDFDPVKAKIAALESGEDARGVTRAAMRAISGKTDDELDKMESRQLEDYTKLKTTAELFPAAMQDSELGKVPEGWEVGTLDRLMKITSGKRPNEKSCVIDFEFLVPLIGASSITGYVKEILYDKAILVIGRVGTHGVVLRVMPPSFPSDNTLVIQSEYYEFIYHILKIIDYKSLNVGSTQPLITQKSIKNFMIVIPKKEVLIDFENIVSCLFRKVDYDNQEIEKLSAIRDALLPKLMSGAIRISLEVQS